MIIIDQTETSSDSRLPPIPGAQISDMLEAVTGADIMVSLQKFPAGTELLIRRHVERGAILIQRKSGGDFLHSITTEATNVALARMIECGAKQFQRIIMSTGLFVESSVGTTLVGTIQQRHPSSVFVSWFDSGVNHLAVETIKRRIGMRGGCYLPLNSDDDIPRTLHAFEKDLRLMRRQPVKEIVTLPEFPPDPPAPDDPLQLPVVVRDGRRVLCALDGVGPKKATALYKVLKAWLRKNHQRDIEPTLAALLWWASCSDLELVKLPKVLGWGPGLRRKVREQLGLYEGQDLRVVNTFVPEEQEND